MHLLVSQRMIRFGNYKYVFNATDIDEFCNLEKDPWEMDNLLDDPAHRGIRHRMMRMLHDWMQETQDRLRGVFGWTLAREGIGHG